MALLMCGKANTDLKDLEQVIRSCHFSRSSGLLDVEDSLAQVQLTLSLCVARSPALAWV